MKYLKLIDLSYNRRIFFPGFSMIKKVGKK